MKDWVLYILIGLLLIEPVFMVIKGIRGPSKNEWAGGNGCNFVKWFGFKSPCCIAHDKAYKEGGWVIARMGADWDLFTCVAKQGVTGAILAIPIFVFVRIFGPIAFQYGKKREIKE